MDQCCGVGAGRLRHIWSVCGFGGDPGACALGTRLIGINNRNLHTFETHLSTTLGMLPHIPAGHGVITESGIHGRPDVLRMNDAGVHGFLVGETLMRAPDPGLALATLLGHPQP